MQESQIKSNNFLDIIVHPLMGRTLVPAVEGRLYVALCSTSCKFSVTLNWRSCAPGVVISKAQFRSTIIITVYYLLGAHIAVVFESYIYYKIHPLVTRPSSPNFSLNFFQKLETPILSFTGDLGFRIELPSSLHDSMVMKSQDFADTCWLELGQCCWITSATLFLCSLSSKLRPSILCAGKARFHICWKVIG